MWNRVDIMRDIRDKWEPHHRAPDCANVDEAFLELLRHADAPPNGLPSRLTGGARYTLSETDMHAEELLLELGYTRAAITELRQGWVIA
jgi:hypothetical protein